MRLTPPFPLSTISQKFGRNDVAVYAREGLVGHTGIDYQVPWGTPIPSAVDSYCYSTMSKDNPNLMAYRAVFTLVDEGEFTYEISYGHCSDMFAKPFTDIKTQEVLANVGNTGSVFANGVEVTQAEKIAGSHEGAHLHFQVRKLRKVPATRQLDPLKHYVNDGFGILTLNGYHYEVPEWDNGYNGCVDPEQFFNTKFIFQKDLWFGQRNWDVVQLQKRLGISTPTGYFGFITYWSVIGYQKAHGIAPAVGFVGPITRSALNSN